jgi:hypothetical protein
MKKMVFCIIPLIMVLMGCAGGAKVKENPVKPAGTSNNSPGMDLDAAIRDAAAQMGKRLPGGTKVAMVSMASSSAQLSEYIIGRLEAALVSGEKLVVVDRANLDKIREEQGFQLSGEVDDNSAKSIGKLLGAGAIVTGTFANIGDVFSLSLKAINIENATVAVSYPADIAKSPRIEAMLASGGGAGSAPRSATQTGGRAPAADPTVPLSSTRIDTSPAGGGGGKITAKVTPPSGRPDKLTITGTTKDSVTLSWDAVEGADSYKVYRSTSENGTYSETTAGTFNGTAFTNIELSPSTEYWYKVAAANAGGTGQRSLTAVKAATLANIKLIPGDYGTLAEKLAYIGTQFDSGVTYDITVEANESLQPTTVMTGGRNVTVYLHSPSAKAIKTISVAGQGSLFIVSANITLKLENIVLKGSGSNNDGALVRIASGGKMEMKTGAKVTGNKNHVASGYGGGISVDGGGILTIFDGEISANWLGGTWASSCLGGGIYINSGGTVNMHGGIIKNNAGSYGGAVYVKDGGHFTKAGIPAGEPSGIIYGENVGKELANKGSGAVVFYNSGLWDHEAQKQRNTTLGGFDEISTDNLNAGWE